MSTRRIAAVALVAALAALGASVAWAVSSTGQREPGWTLASFGPGMMGYYSQSGNEIEDLDAARSQAQRFGERLGLEVGEVMQFTNGYYAELLEPDGTPATEVLISPATGNVFLEHGPAMMWNTRYGLMADLRFGDRGGMMDGGMMDGGMMDGGMMDGGMMDGLDSTWPGAPGETAEPMSPAEAEEIATGWLERAGTGLRPGGAEAFPGYYTLHTLRGDEIAGMLSVNASTGAVWYHWWHGGFVTMIE